ncbi:MAG: restriction endonuclease subunit S, partial [Candidatus Hydrothermales bacterium]
IKFRWEEEFKETEIGEIPKDWEVRRASDCLEFIRGIEPGSKVYKNYGTHRFIRVGDLTGQRREEIYIDIPVKEEDKCKLSDILITFDGTVGIVKRGFEGVFSSGIRKIKTKPKYVGEISYDFLFYFFEGTIKKQLFGFSDEKTTIAHASSSIPHLILFLPPLPEQVRIATVLSYFDDLIENKKKQNEILEKTAMAIFKSWFIDFEPFKDEEFVYNEELGMEIPKGWEVKRIGEIFDLIKGKKCELKEKETEGANPYLLIDTFKNDYYSYWTVEKHPMIGELDIVLVADGESSGKVLRYKAGILGSTLFALEQKVRKELVDLRNFLYLLLKYYEDELMEHRTGSAIPHLDKEFLENFLFYFPHYSIHQKFYSFVDPLFQKIILNQ